MPPHNFGIIPGMSTTQQTPPSASNPFGDMLRTWRQVRGLSQLDLSLEAGVSQRHISFMESGRSQPSREMIVQMAEALDVPLRDRNTLFTSAGFAHLYTEQGLDDESMQPVKAALQMQLDHHAPYPAIVIDRDWNLLMTNEPMQRILNVQGDAETLWAETCGNGPQNVMRLTLHPKGLRSHMLNWDEIGPKMLSRLRREVKLTNSPAMAALLEELRLDESLSEFWHQPILDIEPDPVYTMALGMNGLAINLFSMISTFGTPQDVTTDELRVELFFPIDDLSKEILKKLA